MAVTATSGHSTGACGRVRTECSVVREPAHTEQRIVQFGYLQQFYRRYIIVIIIHWHHFKQTLLYREGISMALFMATERALRAKLSGQS